MSFRFSASLAALAAGLVLAAPAAAQTTSTDQAEIGQSMDEGSAYGEFLAARSALLAGDREQGASRLTAAADSLPSEGFLRERAFTAALFAGDIPTAARLAPAANPESPALESLGRLAQATEALATGHPAVAAQRLSGEPIQFPHATAAHLLRPWALAAAGDWDAALAVEGAPDRIAELFATLGRAQMMEMRKRPDEADALYRTLVEDQVAASLFRPMYGEFLERRGRRADAVKLYEAALAAQPDDPALAQALTRARTRGKPPRLLTLQEGASNALGYAAAAMNAQRQSELSLAYLRLALRINPDQDEAWVLVGDQLAKGRFGGSARVAWGRVRPGSPFFPETRAKVIYSLQADGETAAALALAEETVRAHPNDLRARLTLADLLRIAGRDAEAVAVLDVVIKAGAAGWRPYFMRAIAYDRLDRWPEAEADLERAIALAPEEPELLNYLGYAWIDRGTKVREGLAMVERAVAVRPDSGAMQDSLAWAHYRLGDYARAVGILENAVKLSPSDPEINDHLGDAYWMVGRRDEAAFQWRRVLTLDPDADLRTAAERKLKDGLPSPGPAQPPPASAPAAGQ